MLRHLFIYFETFFLSNQKFFKIKTEDLILCVLVRHNARKLIFTDSNYNKSRKGIEYSNWNRKISISVFKSKEVLKSFSFWLKTILESCQTRR